MGFAHLVLERQLRQHTSPNSLSLYEFGQQTAISPFPDTPKFISTVQLC